MLKCRLTIGPYERELLFPQEAVEMLVPVTVHEAGHAEVASHFGARVLGIALALAAEGMIAMALYVLPPDLSVEDICTIYAAGSAGEILQFGKYSAIGASVDQQDIKNLCGEVPFEPLVEKAKKILIGRRANFDRVTSALKERLFNTNDHLAIGPLPNGRLGVLVLNEDDLARLSCQALK
jgi:hypothetical protein